MNPETPSVEQHFLGKDPADFDRELTSWLAEASA